MIHQISSSVRTFKSIKFRSGLNIVVAEKSKGATDRNTRNGSGKSSLLKIVNFLQGSDCGKDSIFRYASILKENFSMAFDLAGEKTTVTRSGEEPSRILVDGVYDKWPVKPKLHKDSGEMRISNTNWKTVLGHVMFGLPASPPAHSPTYRAMFGYFVRREGSGAFQAAQKQSSQQQNWDVQVNLSALLGLNDKIPRDLQLVRKKEKSISTLQREARVEFLAS